MTTPATHIDTTVIPALRRLAEHLEARAGIDLEARTGESLEELGERVARYRGYLENVGEGDVRVNLQSMLDAASHELGRREAAERARAEEARLRGEAAAALERLSEMLSEDLSERARTQAEALRGGSVGPVWVRRVRDGWRDHG